MHHTTRKNLFDEFDEQLNAAPLLKKAAMIALLVVAIIVIVSTML